ncbi:MAG: hypothetical protein JSU85_14355 [Candidatus Zixiibacteriota bacterium]|nr:MAG: hypothetical protein JSU85_14355 [candidate division Zixibacteria bacterium]
MMKALKGLSLFGGLAVVLTLFFVIGCSNNTPVQPVGPSPADMGKLPQLSSGDESKTSGTVVYVSEYIEKSVGGTIKIERDVHLHEFTIKPEAIEEDTLITIMTVDEEILGKTMILFDFGPEGLKFSIPSILRFDMSELENETPTANLFYFHPEEQKWIYLYSVEVKDGIAEFEIEHFSKYAISD